MFTINPQKARPQSSTPNAHSTAAAAAATSTSATTTEPEPQHPQPPPPVTTATTLSSDSESKASDSGKFGSRYLRGLWYKVYAAGLRTQALASVVEGFERAREGFMRLGQLVSGAVSLAVAGCTAF